MGQACTQQIAAPARRAPQTLAELAVTVLPPVECLSCCGPRPWNYPDGPADVSRMNSQSSLGPNHKQWPVWGGVAPRRATGAEKTPRSQRATPPCGEVGSKAPLWGNLSSPGPSSRSCDSCVLLTQSLLSIHPQTSGPRWCVQRPSCRGAHGLTRALLMGSLGLHAGV